MATVAKKIAKYVVYLILFVILLIGALVLLIFSIDPATLKPTLERELAKQGVEANFGGDIDWRFYPSIGLSVEKLSLNPIGLSDSEQPLAYVDSVAFSVQLMPLLQRKILVNGIRVDSAKLNLVVDKNGKGNWEALGGGETTEEAPSEPQPAAAAPEIRIDELALSGLALDYTDRQTNEHFAVENVSVDASNFNLAGTPFPLTLAVSAATADLPPVSANLGSTVALDTDKKLLALSDANLRLNRADHSSEQLVFSFNSRVSWNEPLTVTTSLSSAAFNLRRLLSDFELADIPTQNPQALSQVALALDLNYSPEQIAITNINATVDATHLKGNTTLTATDKPQVPWHIESHWSGDHINLDDYLPPPTESTTQPAAAEPQPLPLETIRSLSTIFGLTFDEITIMDGPVTNLAVKIQAVNGLVTIDKLNAQAFDGNIATTGTFDARKEIAELKLALDVKHINAGALAQHFAELDKLTGQADATVTVTSRGRTDQALVDNLVAVAAISSESLKVTPFNLEQQYCKLLATLDKREMEKTDWSAFTELAPVTIKARYAGNQVSLESLSADIEKLSTKASGNLNLDTGRFDFPIDVSLADFAAGSQACGNISEKWRKRVIPLRCKGNLSDIGADTCLPDTDRIGAMVKAAAEEKVEAKKQEIKEKADAQVEEKKDELENKAKSKLEKELERLKKKGISK